MQPSDPRTGRSRRTARRLVLLLSAAFVLIAGAAWLRPRWMQDVAVRAALDADSIDDSELRDGGAGDGLSAGTIARFWDTGRLPHRRAAISALTDPKHRSREHAALADRWLPEAAIDPDLEVRTRALGALAGPSAPGQLAAAAWQLDDPDPSVALFADSVLRTWSGRDSRMRLSPVLPERSNLLALPVDEEDKAAIRGAADGWRAWWKASEKPADLSGPVPARPAPVRLPCPPIRLPDLSGRIVDVGSFRGKLVVLNFWTSWCPACLVEGCDPKCRTRLRRKPTERRFPTGPAGDRNRLPRQASRRFAPGAARAGSKPALRGPCPPLPIPPRMVCRPGA